jgi:hypothetical protein
LKVERRRFTTEFAEDAEKKDGDEKEEATRIRIEIDVGEVRSKPPPSQPEGGAPSR